VITRRGFLSAPLAVAACSRRRPAGFRGFAFVANQEGQAVAAVDLQAFAVVRHIRLEGSPSVVIAHPQRPAAYALSPASGTIDEIHVERLSLAGKASVGKSSLDMQLSSDGSALYVLGAQPHRLIQVELDPLRVRSYIGLPGPPSAFSFSGDGRYAVVSIEDAGVWLVNLVENRLGAQLVNASGYGGVRFLSDSRTVVAADREQRRLSLYDVATAGLITHLPLALRPDNLCFSRDNGQLFITGEGLDAVVVVYPFHTPQVAETVLAGRAPGAMATSGIPGSAAFLFVASAAAGEVAILNIPTRKVIAVVAVGAEPGFIAVTPGDQYALVLNRRSGDMAVLRIGGITPNRYKSAALLTVIPVGSLPVSAAVRAV
jgi:DNA-binding beta-propeller fold protein YncE